MVRQRRRTIVQELLRERQVFGMAVNGFCVPEIPRKQLVLWERRLEDALQDEHQVRHLDFLLGSGAFAGTLRQFFAFRRSDFLTLWHRFQTGTPHQLSNSDCWAGLSCAARSRTSEISSMNSSTVPYLRYTLMNRM